MPTVASFDDSYQAGLEVESSSIQQADTDSHEESAVSHLDFAGLDSPTLSKLLVGLQCALLVLFFVGTTYDDDSYSHAQYSVFRDIMVMLLLGFGFLMTFLRKYGLGSVGLTLMITALAVQLNIFTELFLRFTYNGAVNFPYTLSVSSLIDAEFSAAALLISFGAVIGRVSPVQMVIMTVSQSFFYALNKVIVVLGWWDAEDVGGTITIHMFGAYFGVAISYALGPPKASSVQNANPNRVSDILTMIGTTLLWVYWPSFVGATETGNTRNESRCILHTVLGLLGSTVAAFFMSQYRSKGKFNPVHIANSTLAGGVAVGASARLNMTPGGALLLGTLAGLISVHGYVESSPRLERKISTYDTCGVNNLHGYPSLLGGLASILFVAIDSNAAFLPQGVSVVWLCFSQFMAVVCCVVVAVLSGFVTGKLMAFVKAKGEADDYDDALWWIGSYFVDEESPGKVSL